MKKGKGLSYMALCRTLIMHYRSGWSVEDLAVVYGLARVYVKKIISLEDYFDAFDDVVMGRGRKTGSLKGACV